MGILTRIMNKFSGKVIFEAEVEGETTEIRLGLTVQLAIKASADLRSADLYGDLKLVGERPVLVIGPIGSRCAYLQSFPTNKGIYLNAGCFFGTLQEFAHAVENTHDMSAHAQEYMTAITLVEKHAELWTPEKPLQGESVEPIQEASHA